MARRAKEQSSSEERKVNLSIDPEVRANQIIALAEEVAVKRMLDGTISSQVLCHYLKLGTAKYQLELEATKRNNALLEAKTKAIEEADSDVAMYLKAIDAMRTYSGQKQEDTYEDEDD